MDHRRVSAWSDRGIKFGQVQLPHAAQVDLDLVLGLPIAPEDRQHDEFG
ncbi:MAG: hypothetical protein J2P17_36105 [Mycobacterium sp.]|nr:hypothetical protein [Mycobacterium sp.]